jgi:hypothetical protein
MQKLRVGILMTANLEKRYLLIPAELCDHLDTARYVTVP